jgi:hypothetical protein
MIVIPINFFPEYLPLSEAIDVDYEEVNVEVEFQQPTSYEDKEV